MATKASSYRHGFGVVLLQGIEVFLIRCITHIHLFRRISQTVQKLLLVVSDQSARAIDRCSRIVAFVTAFASVSDKDEGSVSVLSGTMDILDGPCCSEPPSSQASPGQSVPSVKSQLDYTSNIRDSAN